MGKGKFDKSLEIFEYANDVTLPNFRIFSIWNVKGEKNYYANYSNNTFIDQSDDMYSLVRIISGEGFLRTKVRKYAFKQHDLFFLKYNDILDYGSDSEIKYFWYNIRGCDTTFSIAQNTQINLPLIDEDIKIFDEIYELLTLRTDLDTAKASLFFSKYYISLAQRITVSSNKSKQFGEMLLVRDYIVHNLKEEINFVEIAKKFGFSDRSLRTHFKNSFDMSPKEYHIHLRMNEACLLLTNTSYNLEFIAEQLGYKSSFYFSKAFKNHYGLSPSIYRQKQIKGL